MTNYTKINYEAGLPKNLEVVPTKSGKYEGWTVFYTPIGKDFPESVRLGKIVRIGERKFHAIASGKYEDVQTKSEGVWWIYHQARITQF